MTSGTQYLNIINRVIESIFVYVVYTKYLRNCIISTSVTSNDQIVSDHIPPNCCKRGYFCPLSQLKGAISTTIFSCSTGAIEEFFVASDAMKFLAASIYLRFVKAFSGTIFRFVASRRNMIKHCIANCTFSNYSFGASKFIFACSRAIFKCFDSIFRHVNFFFTCNTFNIRSFHYAFN